MDASDLENQLRQRDQLIEQMAETIRRQERIIAEQAQQIAHLQGRVAELESVLGERPRPIGPSRPASRATTASGRRSGPNADARNARRDDAPSPRSSIRPSGPRMSIPRACPRSSASSCGIGWPGGLRTAGPCGSATDCTGSPAPAAWPNCRRCCPAPNTGWRWPSSWRSWSIRWAVSIDKARALLAFFCRLDLSKSQADSLLSQLSRLWQQEFDALCEIDGLGHGGLHRRDRLEALGGELLRLGLHDAHPHGLAVRAWAGPFGPR